MVDLEEMKVLAEARVAEALRRYSTLPSTSARVADLARIAIELERSGWTPPPPAPAPEVLAAREYLTSVPIFRTISRECIDQGDLDEVSDIKAFLAGVAWARKEGAR